MYLKIKKISLDVFRELELLEIRSSTKPELEKGLLAVQKIS